MNTNVCRRMVLPSEVKRLILNETMDIIMPETREDLLSWAMGGSDSSTYEVKYDIPGKEPVREATVTLCRNGIVINFDDIYMRRRDPDSIVIADDLPTDHDTHEDRFGKPFDEIRNETFTWLANQKQLILMPFLSGNSSVGLGYESLLVVPANAAFFAGALADLQGFIPASQLPNFFKPKAIVYVAPPFRHTHYDGKQVVIHRRDFDIHEVFSYNLYPGPSAKKGIYSVLLNIGEQEKWLSLHASTVRMVTPYELEFTILHEGASGGGKSEMIGPMHRQSDGRVLLGVNTVNGATRHLTIVANSEMCPVSDDIALSHPKMQKNTNKLVVADGEDGWFLRVNHITQYGTDPETERSTIHPKEPLIFLNMDASPGGTCLIWEPIMDEPGKPCPNPRVILPRTHVQNATDTTVEVDVRSFGIRTPPCTKDKPTYGIAGIFHVLPPALAWLWRLAAPRGYDNPSIVDSEGMTSEGVGTYWPFATGKMADQANLLLEQIISTPATRYILIPNQYIGAYRVGFAPQWITREFLARRGGMRFRDGVLKESRCPLFGYALETMRVDGQDIPKYFLQVELQTDVGTEAYDAGAKMLTAFFKKEIRKYLSMDLKPLGKRIVEACLNNARVSEYYNFIPQMPENHGFNH